MDLEVELDGLFRQNESYDYGDYDETTGDSNSKDSQEVLIVLFSVEIVVGVLGYGLLLAVLAQRRRSWTISDTFVLHQSVADILLMFTLPFWAATAAQSGEWYFGNVLLKISVALFNVSTEWCVEGKGGLIIDNGPDLNLAVGQMQFLFRKGCG